MAFPDDKQQDLRLSLPLSNEGSQPQKEVQKALFSRKNALRVFLLFFALVTLYSQSAFLQRRFSPVFGKPSVSARFFYNITSPQGLCVSPTGHDVSHSGYIGLKGDTEHHPKRSFFWFFEAEQNAKDAPVILAFGGGPGTSGMMYATFGQSPCVISENGTIPNPHRWTEHYNLIILDHPVNVGFSYGTHVNNSHQAALDVYDFLQKFYRIYPDFLKNPFILAGGSYGGVYVPNIASVVYTENLAIRGGTGQPGAKLINLHSMMLSNPVVDPLSHFRWLPYYRCEVSGIYNETTCRNVYSGLPACLEAVDLSYKQSTVRHRVAALETCYEKLEGDTQGYILEDVRVKCKTDPADPAKCHPQFKWVNDFFTASSTRTALGIPDHVNFTSLNMDVNKEFSGYGDFVQPHSLLYEPLLRDGIRLLHYVGAQDANCAWPGVFSALKLIDSPFQEEFTTAPDLQWPANTEGVSTVRAVGPDAGNFTYFLVQNAGHFVVNNQRALVKQIVEHWIDNKPWYD